MKKLDDLLEHYKRNPHLRLSFNFRLRGRQVHINGNNEEGVNVSIFNEFTGDDTFKTFPTMEKAIAALKRWAA